MRELRSSIALAMTSDDDSRRIVLRALRYVMRETLRRDAIGELRWLAAMWLEIDPIGFAVEASRTGFSVSVARYVESIANARARTQGFLLRSSNPLERFAASRIAENSDETLVERV